MKRRGMDSREFVMRMKRGSLVSPVFCLLEFLLSVHNFEQ